jgi:hypothetical protein
MYMHKFIPAHTLAVALAAVVLATASSVFAVWSDPTDVPPNANTAAPLNTGATTQTKTGGLWAASMGTDNGFCIGVDCITAWSEAGGSSTWSTNGSHVYYNGGNVGIGDTTPDGSLKLDVEGQVGATQYCDQNGANCTAAAALGGGGGTQGSLCGLARKGPNTDSCGNATYTSVATCNGASVVSSCPSGYTLITAETGYWYNSGNFRTCIRTCSKN